PGATANEKYRDHVTTLAVPIPTDEIAVDLTNRKNLLVQFDVRRADPVTKLWRNVRKPVDGNLQFLRNSPPTVPAPARHGSQDDQAQGHAACQVPHELEVSDRRG